MVINVDLNNLFNQTNREPEGEITSRDLVVSDNASFIDSVVELYAMEGFSKPLSQQDYSFASKPKKETASLQNVILDMRSSSNLVEDVSQIASQLDISVSLIVVGVVDSIRIYDLVMSIGATYVLWDEELNGLLTAVQLSALSEGPKTTSTRVAKRILMIGSKGGVGLSTVTSALSYSLSEFAGLKVLLVDHDYGALNCDIFLGVKSNKSKPQLSIDPQDIDEAVALTYISSMRDKLDYLVLDKHGDGALSHTERLYSLSSQLASKYNFIVDSLPFSAFDDINFQEINDIYHRIFVVCEPSVSSLRSYNLMKRKLGKAKHEVIFSLSRQNKDFLMTLANAKARIKCRQSIDIPYEAALEKAVLQNGLGDLLQGRFGTPISELVLSLTGKNIKKNNRFGRFQLWSS